MNETWMFNEEQNSKEKEVPGLMLAIMILGRQWLSSSFPELL